MEQSLEIQETDNIKNIINGASMIGTMPMYKTEGFVRIWHMLSKQPIYQEVWFDVKLYFNNTKQLQQRKQLLL